MHADWLKIVFLYDSMETQVLEQAVDAMMARAKILYVLIIKNHQIDMLFSFFPSHCILKEIKTCTLCFCQVLCLEY